MLETQDAAALKIPAHIGIICDGNGRWAKARGLPRTVGHFNGAKAFQRLMEAARDLGIRMMTFWVFSTENWSRPQDEVDYLMELFLDYLTKRAHKLIDNKVRFRHLGDLSRLSPKIREGIRDLEEKTRHFTEYAVNIALNYGGRPEIVMAARGIAEDVKAGLLDPGDIDESVFNRYTYFAEIPKPDLIIRTSGEQRLSGFMNWANSYAELYFPSYHFPDMDADKLREAVVEYSRRDRRFGGVKA